MKTCSFILLDYHAFLNMSSVSLVKLSVFFFLFFFSLYYFDLLLGVDLGFFHFVET